MRCCCICDLFLRELHCVSSLSRWRVSRITPRSLLPRPQPVLRDARDGEDLPNLILREAAFAEHYDGAVALLRDPIRWVWPARRSNGVLPTRTEFEWRWEERSAVAYCVSLHGARSTQGGGEDFTHRLG